MNATVITDLIERAGRAKGPDRTLDGAIALGLGQPQAFFAQFSTSTDGMPFDPDLSGDSIDGPGCFDDAGTWAGGGRSWKAPPFTFSVDAVLAAAERCRDQGIDAATLLSDALDRLTRKGFRIDQPLAPQLARALLIEFLTALQSQTPGPTGASNEGGR